MTLGMGKRKLTEYKKGKCITRSIFGKLPAVRSLQSVAKSSVRKMSLEEQQDQEQHKKQHQVTNHYRVEITEFQEDSEDSEGKNYFQSEFHIPEKSLKNSIFAPKLKLTSAISPIFDAKIQTLGKTEKNVLF